MSGNQFGLETQSAQRHHRIAARKDRLFYDVIQIAKTSKLHVLTEQCPTSKYNESCDSIKTSLVVWIKMFVQWVKVIRSKQQPGCFSQRQSTKKKSADDVNVCCSKCFVFPPVRSFFF